MTYSLTIPQLLLRSVKVEVNIETFQELSYWVPVSVRFLLKEIFFIVF